MNMRMYEDVCHAPSMQEAWDGDFNDEGVVCIGIRAESSDARCSHPSVIAAKTDQLHLHDHAVLRISAASSLWTPGSVRRATRSSNSTRVMVNE